MKKVLFFTFFLPLVVFAQINKKEHNTEDFIIIKNDSLTIPLNEVIIFKKKSFTSTKEKKYYYWYYKKVHNAYPFAKLAAEKLTEINSELESIKSNRKRKKHIKKMQNFMEGEFSDQLKDLSRTEGRILIKLIHRQTGIPLFNLIKDYRSGWKAFWYNSTAKVFKLSLKEEYHPEEVALDFMIEDILQRSFSDGTLNYQDSKIPIDYFELQSKWKGLDIVAVIDAYFDKYR